MNTLKSESSNMGVEITTNKISANEYKALTKEAYKTFIFKKQLLEAIVHIRKNERVHIAKLKTLDRIRDYFGDETALNFARFIANKIWQHYMNGSSLCKTQMIEREQKQSLLMASVSAINECFGDSCPVDNHTKINEIFDEIEKLKSYKRLYIHATRTKLLDPDLLCVQECLGFFIFDSNKYAGFWKRGYDIAKYYCVSYSDMRFRLDEHSIPRIMDILEFVETYLETREA